MIPNQYIKNIYKVTFVLLVVLSVFFAVKIMSEVRTYAMMGSSNANTITLSGHGEVMAVPDIANVYFTIRKDGKTVKEAQDAVAVIEKSSLDFLKNNNIADKDVQTSNASFNPKYEFVNDTASLLPCNQFGCPPRTGKSVITGYEASESITVKIRNTDDVGKILQGLGGLGVTDLNGPNFTIDNEDGLKAEARKKAIDDARTKADGLAKDLGVRLGRIANFSESSGGFFPVAFAKDSLATNGVQAAAAPATLPVGQNTISSDVTITYEIR